jgi:hypothetical protein
VATGSIGFDDGDMTPWEYALRYLPVQVPGPAEAYPISIARYHIGAPTAAQQQLWGALGDHLSSHQKTKPAYRLELIVNGARIQVGKRDEIRMSAVRPFYGKGSPEDCQIVLQLALLLRLTTPERLQAWADTNLGLDCNGFVGNYIFHDVMGQDWRMNAGEKQPGPSTNIATIFQWAAGSGDFNALDDLATIEPSRSYLIVRADSHGRVIPGGPNSTVGHIAITQPGEIMRQSFVSNSMGGLDLRSAELGLYNKLALRTVEAAGPVDGVGKNWLVFQRPAPRLKKVFEVRRDKIHKLDTIKIAPLP